MTTLTLVHSQDRAPRESGSLTEKYADALRLEGLSENTVRAYLSDIKRYGVDLPDVFTNPGAHAELAVTIVDEDAPPRTRLRRLAALARFYEFLNPGATTNPYRTVRRPRLGIVLPTVVPEPEESRALVEALRAEGTRTGRRDAAALALMAGEGLRVSEVCSLTARCLDPESRTLLVEGKGRKTRQVPLSAYVLDVLMEYIGTDFPRRITADTRLFPITPRTLQRAVKRAASLAHQDPRLHPHALRHGFATAVQTSEKDLRLTADLLGHSSVTTTAIYTHVSDTRRTTAVDAAL